ncbi:MAG TPA: hypothetical protein VFH74_01410 [Gaiellales bacterium]|nr:hypothetical protein [Gaiellales bacterium]
MIDQHQRTGPVPELLVVASLLRVEAAELVELAEARSIDRGAFIDVAGVLLTLSARLDRASKWDALASRACGSNHLAEAKPRPMVRAHTSRSQLLVGTLKPQSSGERGENSCMRAP